MPPNGRFSIQYIHFCLDITWLFGKHSTFVLVFLHEIYITGIKHGFSCINIHQVLWEVLKTVTKGRSFQHFQRDLANVNALKNHVQLLLKKKKQKKKQKTYATFHFISCTILFGLFTDVSRTQFPWTMVILGLGNTHLTTAANLWPRYNHTESCVAMH